MSQSPLIAPRFGDCRMQPMGKGGLCRPQFPGRVLSPPWSRLDVGADSILGEGRGCQQQPPLVLGKQRFLAHGFCTDQPRHPVLTSHSARDGGVVLLLVCFCLCMCVCVFVYDAKCTSWVLLKPYSPVHTSFTTQLVLDV